MRRLADRDKEREFKLRKMQLTRSRSVDSPVHVRDNYFDVSKQIRLVSPFKEKEVDTYFLHFEKIALSLN